jgi:hypothetical protein
MHAVSIEATTSRATIYSDDRTTRALLLCGILAGPIFVAAGLIQAFTIPGFDLTHHYLSQLSSGELGWIQRANFVVAGFLAVAAAAGVRRTLRGGRLGRTAPVLLALFGVGFVGAGLFVTDPAFGFPPGTADTIPTNPSWHSVMHGVSAILGFAFFVGACLTLGYRFARERRWGWAVYSVATGVVAFGLPSVPNPWGGVLLFVGGTIAWSWVTAVSFKLARQLD